MSRPAKVEINLSAFRQNYRIAKQQHGGKALAVIKANAYGHGAIPCAHAIAAEADGYAVACIEEALQLRQAGISHPILLLEGFFEAVELAEIVVYDFWIVVHAMWQVEILLASKLTKPVQVWLKMDSGMHRVGLSADEYSDAYTKLNQHQNVSKIVCMSHFANADNINSEHTLEQLALFKNIAPSQQEFSLANSAAILAWPQTHGNWARPGIMLYGADPLMKADTPLRAVMQFSSKIIAIRHIKAGQSIGYGSIFSADRDTIVGVVACGYADGYPRSASNLAPVAVNGKSTQLIGRVSMDMLFVDLTDIADATIGSEVELWGNNVLANDVAKAANTIAYELFCNVKRAKFVYTDSNN
ncbi:MAG: alanine racemase [Methylophilus sp.]|jgi:alanine racemase